MSDAQTTIPRRYTLAEIDRMRNAIDLCLIPPGRSYQPAEKSAQVEDRLRTYMFAGITAEELEKRCGKILAAWSSR